MKMPSVPLKGSEGWGIEGDMNSQVRRNEYATAFKKLHKSHKIESSLT
ncbi:hypothetical protein [Methanohalophilus sp.]|nr:hypothetical protein [Methanohalophilus sp.]